MSIEQKKHTKELTKATEEREIQQTRNELLKIKSESLKIKEFLDNFCTNEEIKKDLAEEIKKYPLFYRILSQDLSKDKKEELLKEALQKQKEATECMDKNKLDKIAKTMEEEVLKIAKDNKKIKDFLMQKNSDITTPKEKEEIFQTIINKFSEAFGIKPPRFYTNWVNISWLGISSLIKIDWNKWNIGQLMHEYTHYLQNQWKTSNQKYMKQSMDYYVLPIKGELKNLTDNIYNNSLIEQEAEYTRKVAQQKIFQEIRKN